jgi:hypothetical protein|tara:strand:+ start:1100 stop:1285 length:186 start_codon:yes stop_codon:yes gene_type:complete
MEYDIFSEDNSLKEIGVILQDYIDAYVSWVYAKSYNTKLDYSACLDNSILNRVLDSALYVQ